MICERCSNQAYFLEKCNYCEKMVCRACEKSSKRRMKIKRYVICKTCWSDIKKRQKFKSA
ncbi:Uncharacterised protein [Candidatus Gugararchaeum adminiculabundum]|nr:Uncharacterised protein [Candidatus Gugararchaeum adminiculabundum]